MPIPLSPNDTFDLVLRGDRTLDEQGKPTKEQPADAPIFVFRCLSGRDQRKLAAMIDEIEHPDTAAGVIDKTFATLRFVLAGWRNLRDRDDREIPYDPAEADTVLTYHEAQELIYRAWGWAPDVNFYGSPSNTASNGSASKDSAAPVPPAADSPAAAGQP